MNSFRFICLDCCRKQTGQCSLEGSECSECGGELVSYFPAPAEDRTFQSFRIGQQELKDTIEAYGHQ